ncbi:hypothetical protein PINS_up010818 [Pythium insidiosum]|nr:hypothetical protein PINS_up010818 [Pythium insidiosum]
MRKEWQRKIDVQGRLFWYRNSIDGRLGTAPGYVIRFRRRQDGGENIDTQHNSTQPKLLDVVDTTSQDTSNTDVNPHDRSVDNPALDLTSVDFDLFESSQADGAMFPHDTLHFADADALKQSIKLAARDFPSRFSHFVVHTALLANSSDVRLIRVTSHRDYVLEQSMNTLSCIPSSDIHLGIRVVFKGESGIDAGGLHREWLMLLNEKLIEPDVGLFRCINRRDQTYFINPNSAVDNGTDHLVYFFGAGRMIGRALLDGAVLGFHLSVPLLKMILGTPITFDDLEFFDEELHRNLKWLLEHEGVEELDLDFTVGKPRGLRLQDQNAGGNNYSNTLPATGIEVVDLIPGGRNVRVTDANKLLYVDRRFKYVLFESVWEQLCVFLRGFYDVIPEQLLLGFDYEELDYLLCGTGEIDVNDWEQNTRISFNLEDNPRVLKWFWELVREMDSESRRRLLHFSTGSSRVPLVGFKGLTSYDGRLCPFTLKGIPFVTDQYIRSHACFNMLDLPLYSTKEEMRLALHGLLDADVYGFTTV